jgi:hypothetical protein
MNTYMHTYIHTYIHYEYTYTDKSATLLQANLACVHAPLADRARNACLLPVIACTQLPANAHWRQPTHTGASQRSLAPANAHWRLADTGQSDPCILDMYTCLYTLLTARAHTWPPQNDQSVPSEPAAGHGHPNSPHRPHVAHIHAPLTQSAAKPLTNAHDGSRPAGRLAAGAGAASALCVSAGGVCYW